MAYVGIFDSGVGGLSVLGEFRQMAPEHPVIYLADQAWAPYGERSLDEVRDRAVVIARFLIDQGCDLVIVACNSASAAALHHLREVFPNTQFVGMEPAVKPAASQSERGVIGVLATDATFQGELYASVVDRHANGTEVVQQACPGLADAVERVGVDSSETVALLSRYLEPLRGSGIDTLVLGCTHYPFLVGHIRRLLGDNITVIDPAPAVARQALRLLRPEPAAVASKYLTTGDPVRFATQVQSLLGLEVAVSHTDLGAVPVVVHQGDLTAQHVDAVVNAANRSLQHGGGVAAALVRAGGAVIQEESDAWVRANGVLAVGQAAVTTAGSMPAKHVIHVAGPVYRSGQDNEGMLRAAVSGALDAAARVGARSIAFPAISAGIYGYPIAEATAVLADEIARWLDREPGRVDEVRLIGYSDAATEHLANGLAGALRSER